MLPSFNRNLFTKKTSDPLNTFGFKKPFHAVFTMATTHVIYTAGVTERQMFQCRVCTKQSFDTGATIW